MPRGKTIKWRLNKTLERVYEAPGWELRAGHCPLRGRWGSEVFGNDRPITLELGCGRGDYTVALARQYPERNFVGVDIKGHRFWHGANASHEEGLANTAFLRARIEYIDVAFGPAEARELWLTFSDPRPQDRRGTKRLTSPLFLARYDRILQPGSRVHVKTDSPLLYERTRAELLAGEREILVDSDDVHGRLVHEAPDELRELLAIQTHYEAKWLAVGRRIHYLCFRSAAPRAAVGADSASPVDREAPRS